MSTPTSSTESTPTTGIDVKQDSRQLTPTPNPPPILPPAVNLSRRRPLPLLSAALAASSAAAASNPNGSQLELLEEIEPYVRRRRATSACPVGPTPMTAVGSDDSSQSSSQPNNDRARRRMEALSEEEQQLLRTCINSRERKRMHDLNDALDDLRSALPYGHGDEGNSSASSAARKLSKINTIILAANWIRQLTKEMEDLRRQLNDNPSTERINGEKKMEPPRPLSVEPGAKAKKARRRLTEVIDGDEQKKGSSTRQSDTVSPYASIPSLLQPKVQNSDQEPSPTQQHHLPLQPPSPFLPPLLIQQQQANLARSLLYHHQSISAALPPGLMLPPHPLFGLFNPASAAALLSTGASSAFKPSRPATIKGKSSQPASRKRALASNEIS